MRSVKEYLKYLLARRPVLYERVLCMRREIDYEKLAFLHSVKSGHIVFDIGANRGRYTILFSHLAGPSGEVHAFEPVSQTYQILSQEVSRFKRFNNVFLNHTALGDRVGQAQIHMPDEDIGQASLRQHTAGSWEYAQEISTFPCHVTTLDRYAADRKLRRVDFIKCDAEGAELLILKGGQETLSQFRPVLQCEISSCWSKPFGYVPDDVVAYLKQCGYQYYYGIFDDGMLMLEDPVHDLASLRFFSANLLCANTNVLDQTVSRFQSKINKL